MIERLAVILREIVKVIRVLVTPNCINMVKQTFALR